MKSNVCGVCMYELCMCRVYEERRGVEGCLLMTRADVETMGEMDDVRCVGGVNRVDAVRRQKSECDEVRRGEKGECGRATAERRMQRMRTYGAVRDRKVKTSL